MNNDKNNKKSPVIDVFPKPEIESITDIAPKVSMEPPELNCDDISVNKIYKEFLDFKKEIANSEKKSKNFQWILGITTTILGAILGFILSVLFG